MKRNQGSVASLADLLVKHIGETDKMIRENYPMDQPYIYTASGDAIVIRKIVGFETKD